VSAARFTLPAATTEGDIVLLFPDSDAGKTVSLTVDGLSQGAQIARGLVSVTLRRGETVTVSVLLGKEPDGGMPVDAGPDAQKVCGEQGTFCSGDELVTCSGGVVTSSKSCPLGCLPQSAPETARCRWLVPSNGIPSTLFESKVGSLTVSDTVKINTDTGSVSSGSAPFVVQVPQLGAPTIIVLVYRSINVAPGAVLKAAGANALALVATEEITLDGQLIATASGGTGGPGGGRGADLNTKASGPGPGGNGVEKSLEAVGGGAGGSGWGGPGGEGGPGASASGGVVKSVKDNPTLVPLRGGSGGGRGGRVDGSSIDAGRGGGGGGAVQIVAGSSITIGSSGGINVGGAGGGASNTYVPCGGGGGGAGGAILLEAPTVLLKAGAVLAANGGGGGGGAGSKGGSATSGATGALGVDPAAGGQPGPSGAKGGRGAAKGNAASSGSTGKVAGGGGGGGLGYLRLNSRSGKVDAGSAVISAGSSQGTLTTE
jgi:hypothetical protein